MAALEAATQSRRVRAAKGVIGSLTLAYWVAGSSPAMVSIIFVTITFTATSSVLAPHGFVIGLVNRAGLSMVARQA